ncbi:hypothetical protein [Niallia circulans]|uniref:hypothetical protein n=1 Tax=Niallia circulans TaxID=1397 RepID=UPI0004E142B1|nr:hypothetical protein [Niallia circulans]MCF2650239.1 hypothetical protein [Niallia circulans]
MKFVKLADHFWNGMTLTFVNHKSIIYPYLSFMIIAFLFEIFLTVLIGISIYFFYQFGYSPEFSFYIGCCLVFLLLAMTIITIKSIFRKINMYQNVIK